MSQRMVRHPVRRSLAHDRLVLELADEDRAWLARMADVLPGGWVVLGMALPPRGGVVNDDRYPGGVRLVVAPAAPARYR